MFAMVLCVCAAMSLNVKSYAADLNVIENLDGDYAYIKELSIDGKSTGSEPFDDDDDAGNDSSADNDIIRSFDTAVYSVKFVTTSYDDQQYFENARVGFRFILDETDEDVATFDLESMLWVDTTPGYEPSIDIVEIDGRERQVLTCYRRLVSTSDVPTVVPSTNTVNLVLSVNAAQNGTKLDIDVESWCEHNVTGGECPTHDRDEVAKTSIPTLTVSAAPKYNIMLEEMTDSHIVGNGEYDFDDMDLARTSDAMNIGAGVVNGRLYGYGIVIQIYNDSPSKRLKGIEIPDGPITFDLSLSTSLRVYGRDPVDVTDTYTPLVWSLDGNENEDDGDCARDIDINGQDKTFAIDAVPFNSIDPDADYEQNWYNSCYQGGTWHGVQDGGDAPAIHVTVDGYEINIDSFPYTNAGCGEDESHIYYAGDEVQNIGCFSAGELFVVQPLYNDETGESFFDEFDCDNGDFSVTVTDTKLHATSVSGQETYDDGNANQTNTEDDFAIMTQSALRGVEASPYIFYSHTDNVDAESEGTDALDFTHNYDDGTDSALPGSNIRICAGYEVTTYQHDTNIVASNIFIRFDDKAIRYDPTREIGYRGDDLAPNRALFAAKPDGTGWVDDEEQQTTPSKDLVFYESYQDLLDAGAVCVGLMYETRTIQDEISYHWRRSSFPVTVLEDAEIRHVAMTTAESLLWTMNDIKDLVVDWSGKDASELTDDDYQEYLDTQFPSIADKDAWLDDDGDLAIEPSITLDDSSEYVKTKYDDYGFVENHSGTYQFGDSLLILGEKMIVDKNVAQQANGDHKEIFDIDYAQRYVDYEISSSFDMSDKPSAASDYKTSVTITDIVPEDLEYVPGSSYLGGTYAESNNGQAPGVVTGGTPLEPTSVRNDDGLIELSWEIPDLAYGEKIEDIHFTCMIGTPGDDEHDVQNNQQIVNNVEIRSTNDIRDIRPEYLNTTSCTIRISKLHSQSLAIRPVPTLNEQSSEVSFVSMIGNYSGTTKVGVGVNLMPYDGDGMSEYDGTYEVLGLDVEDTSDMSQLTFYCTNDAGIRGTDISEITQDDIEDGWVECEFDHDTGEVTVPDGYEHMVAWAVIDSSMTPNERIDITTNIMPSKNAGGNVYGSSLSDGDNVVTARLYVVGRFVSGHVFIDANGNDAYDEGEVLFENASVRLVNEDGDVVESVDGDACEMLTDENGYYEFDAVQEGEFRIEFKPCDGEDWSYLSAVAVDATDDDVDSDAIPTLEDDVLIGAYIDGIEMPSIDDMASSVYRSDHNDLGLRVEGTADIDIVKSATVKHQESCADKGETAHVGDAIEYRAVITNTGSTTLTNVWVTDELLSIDKKVVAEELAAGDDVEISLGTHTVTADDIAASIVRNSVTTNGTPPRYVTPPEDASDEVETPVVGSAEIGITKSTTVTQVENPEVGDVIPYTITITNVGDVTITDITATDALSDIGDLTLDKTTLAAGESVTVNVEHKLTQADIENGQVVNTAMTTGKFGDDEPSDESDEVVTTLEQTPAISLVKSTDDNELDAIRSVIGEVIEYNFVITNIGNVKLTDVSLVDHLDGVYDIAIDWDDSSDASTGDGVLSVGETVSATAKYKLTQNDIENGQVINTATASGKHGDDEVSDDSDSVSTTVTQTPAISLVKSTDDKVLDAEHSIVGEVLNYDFIITNTGNVALHDVDLTDHLAGVYDLNIDWDGSSDDATDDGTLSVGEKVTATAKYNLTQNDIDTGKVLNTATVTGLSPNDEKVEDDASTETVLIGKAAIELVKSTDDKELDAEHSVASETIDYKFTITNTGNVTLHDVNLVDHLAGVYDLAIDWESSSDNATGEGILLSGETVTATAKYNMIQADIDTGKVENTATVTGMSPSDEQVDDDASAETVLTAASSINLVKSTESKQLDAEHSVIGEVIDYTFTITNTGNVTLHDVELVDHLDGVYDLNVDWSTSSDESTADGVLSVGETVSATAKYKLTQADIDARKVTNTATATGTSPADEQVDDDASAETMLTGTPAISLVKSTEQKEIDAEHSVVGTVIDYDFVITNTGNVTLRNVKLTDHLNGVYDLNVDWGSSSDDATEDGVLSVGETVSAIGKYKLTQGDIDAGKVINTATVTGTSDNGEDVKDDASTETTLSDAPTISLVKSTDDKTLDAEHSVVGEVVDYDFVITNIGNVTLHDVKLTDHLDGVYDMNIDWNGSSDDATDEGILSVGETVKATAKYKLTQSDIDTGKVTNTATTTGISPKDEQVDDDSSAETVLAGMPAIKLDKSTNIDSIDAEHAVVGARIPYVFTITNTGSVTLHDVVLTDKMLGDAGISVDIDWDGSSDAATGTGVLSPSETVSGTAKYNISDADIKNGKVVNNATVTGTPDNGEPVSDDDDATTTIEQATPHLTLTKTSDVKLVSGDDAVTGTVVSWTIKVTNDGNVRVDGIAIDDKLTGAKLITDDFDGTLDAGESVELKVEYALTDKDVDGSDVATKTVSNTASAHGTYHGDKTVQSNEDTDTVDIRKNPSIVLEKTVDIARIDNDDVKVGKLLTYTFVVRNTGDMTVNATHIIDSIGGLNVTIVDSPNGNGDATLPPDSEMTFTAQYAITQADIDAGKVINTAHAAGELVDGTPIESNTDDAITDIVTSQHIAIEKSVDIDQINDPHVGDILTYSFIVTNDGDTTLDNVGINDDKNGLSDVIIDWSTSSDDATGDGTLSPSETANATATYAITQADIDAGEVVNVATSYGDTINSGKHVESVPDDAVTIISTKPHISVVKDVNIKQNDDAKVGNVLTYSFTVKNDGNVTLTDIGIDDNLAGISELVFDWANSTDASTADGTLSPNESVTATATYAITQADIDNGNVVNTATSHGYHDGEHVESEPNSVETVLNVKQEIPIDDNDDDIDEPVTDDDAEYDDDSKQTNGTSSSDGGIYAANSSTDEAHNDDQLVKTDDNVPSIISTGVSNVFVAIVAGISLIVSGVIIIRKIK